MRALSIALAAASCVFAQTRRVNHVVSRSDAAAPPAAVLRSSWLLPLAPHRRDARAYRRLQVYVMLENHAFDNVRLLLSLTAALQLACPVALPTVALPARAFSLSAAPPQMLGWLPGLPDPLTPTNLCNSFRGQQYCATRAGAYSDPDPEHSVPATAEQLYGTSTPAAPGDPATVLMSGFVASYASAQNASIAPIIMDAFDPSHVPVISTLATEFTLLDRYHSSLPGPTFPNRLFALSATSHGFGDNDDVQTALGWPQRSIFGALDALGASSRVYFSDVPSALLLADARNLSAGATGFRLYEDDFARDVAAGDLPAFSFVEPAYLDIPGVPASDQHPAHDVAVGERFLKGIYEALRASPLWNETVLLITWDEHGGE